ncbi:MAG: carbon-nitrogen hydrolase family protein [Candidatus Kapaibacterium sp.]
MKIGLAQIAPVWLDREKTIAKMTNYIALAARNGCRIVAFGEAVLPGYPFWVELTDGARFNSDIQKDIFAHYAAQAVSIEGGDLAPICDTARANNVDVIAGTVERAANRGGHSLYCSMVYIDNRGAVRNVHRKLMPTYEERLVWAVGDGHGLRTFPLDEFTMGGLNCWENWMPLSRAALYGQGENLHFAIWPGNTHNTEDITRCIAKESRSYVVSVSGVMRRDNIPENIPHRDLIYNNAPEIMANGGSCAAAPDGRWLLEPADSAEELFTIEIDYKTILRERQNFDPAGHYSRPDVTKLSLNRQRQSIIEIIDN